MSDRAEFEATRAAGLKARHETRVERAIRRQVAEEIAAAIKAERINPARGWNHPDFDAMAALWTKDAMEMCERIASQIGETS